MFDLPDDDLLFTPDANDGESELRGSLRIRLARSTDYYIYDGIYATLYEADATDAGLQDADGRIAFKVFRRSDDEADKLAREEYAVLRSLDGLDGHAPHAYSFGYAKNPGGFGLGRPTIVQEYLPGTLVVDAVRLCNDDPHSEAFVLEVMQCVWAISLPVYDLAKQGVRHGDLSYTNVLLSKQSSPDSLGRKYSSAIIDFGQAAVRKDRETYGKPGTDFFSAPELLAKGGVLDKDRGRTSADVYSIGSLALYMLARPSFANDEEFFQAFKDGGNKAAVVLEDWLSGCPHTGLPHEVFALLIRLCMHKDPADRLALSDLVGALEEACTTRDFEDVQSWLLRRDASGSRPLSRFMASYRLRPNNEIYGRDDELWEMGRALRARRIVYLWGFGGIGKTATALAFASRAVRSREMSDLGIKKVYLISFDTSLHKTFADLGASLPTEADSDEAAMRNDDAELAELALRTMEEELGRDVLVILDGLPETLDGDDAALLERMASDGEYWLIVTARCAPLGMLNHGGIYVSSMGDDALDAVYIGQLRNALCERSLLPRLYRAVGRNTLAVKLVGGLVGQSAGMITLANILKVLESGNLGNDEIDEYEVRIGGMRGSDSIRGHIRSLLSLSNLTGAELRTLSMLLLVPSSGVLVSTLREGFRRYDQSLGVALGSLQSRCWIEMDRDEGRVFLHPLVRDVCYESEEVPPTSFTCTQLVSERSFLDVLYDNARWHLERGELSYMRDFEAMAAVAETLLKGDIRDSAMARVLRRRSEALHALGRPEQEVEVLEKLVTLLSETSEDWSWPEGLRIKTMAEVLRDLCVAQCDLGWAAESVQTASRALRLLSWYSEPGEGGQEGARFDDADTLSIIASLLATRGFASHDLWSFGGHDKWELQSALVDKEAALNIVRGIGGGHWRVASVLYTLAYTEFCFDEMKEQAVADEEEAISLLRATHHKPNYETELLLATALNFLGFFLCGSDGVYDASRVKESLDLKEEAIRIRYQYLDPHHRDIGRSHNNISLSLRELGDLDGALRHALIAMRIRSDNYGVEPEHDRAVYTNARDLQHLLGINDEEIESRLAVLEIPSSYTR